MNSRNVIRSIVRWGVAICLSAPLVLAGIGLAGHPIPMASAQLKGVALTIYNQNLALVKEIRTETLKAGFNELRFPDVAAQIEPTSVLLRSLTDPAGLTILEQNFEYDLVSTEQLYRRYLGQAIRVVLQDNTVYTSTLLSAEPELILQSPDGGVTILRKDAVREISFPQLPGGLITKPTLVWQLDAKKAGPHDLEVTYLTGGINWNADYVVRLAADEKSLDLDGWVTLDNRSGASYRDATLKLVAGDIRRVEQPRFAPEAKVMAAAAPMPAVEERQFFEYYIYEVKRPVSLNNNHSKQIEFMGASGVKTQKSYIYEGSQTRFTRWWGPATEPGYGITGNKKVNIILEFANKEEAGLGMPLPAGHVRVYKLDVDGSPQFVGEDTIDHTPKDETVRLYVGDAFDIVGERVQTKFMQLGEKSIEESFKITLRNHKDADVTVRVIEHLYRWSEWEITEKSAPYKQVDAQTVEWEVTVPKAGEASVTYSVLYRW